MTSGLFDSPSDMTVTQVDNADHCTRKTGTLPGVDEGCEKPLENFLIDDNFNSSTDDRFVAKKNSNNITECDSLDKSDIRSIKISGESDAKDQNSLQSFKVSTNQDVIGKASNGNCCGRLCNSHLNSVSKDNEIFGKHTNIVKAYGNGLFPHQSPNLDIKHKTNGQYKRTKNNREIHASSAPTSPILRKQQKDKNSFVEGFSNFIGYLSGRNNSTTSDTLEPKKSFNSKTEDNDIRSPTIDRLCNSFSKFSHPLYQNWLKQSPVQATKQGHIRSLRDKRSSDGSIRRDRESVNDAVFDIDLDKYDNSDILSESSNSIRSPATSVRSKGGNSLVSPEDSDSEIVINVLDADVNPYIPENHPQYERRASRWSATILFVTSQVHTVVNLADFCPNDGYETLPTPVSTRFKPIMMHIMAN